MDTNRQHISRLEEAQNLLREALDILKDVASDTDNRMASAYITPHLAIMIDNEHDYLSRDYSVEDWIGELRDEDEGANDDEDCEAYDDCDDGSIDDDTEDDYVYVPPPPVDPSTFSHTPEFAKNLWNAYGESHRKIPAIQMYRQEYGVGLKEAKDAVEYIFDQHEEQS